MNIFSHEIVITLHILLGVRTNCTEAFIELLNTSDSGFDKFDNGNAIGCKSPGKHSR